MTNERSGSGALIERAARVWVLGAAAMVVLAVVGLVLAIAGHEPVDANYVISTTTGGVSFSLLAGLIAAKRPANRMWIVYGVIGASLSLTVFGAAYAYFSYFHHTLPFAALASWWPSWMYVPGLVGLLTFALVLFPTGRVPSRRWWPVTALAAVSILLKTIPFAIASWPYRGLPMVDPDAPTPNTAAVHLAGTLDAIGTILLLPAALLSIAAVIVRYRRARADERQQMKWLVFALVIVFASLAKGFLTNGFGDVVEAIDYAVIAAAVGVAILKYRLYDIDVVINRTLLYGGLAAFITVVYVAIVVGIGALLQSTSGPNLALSIAATALVAGAFAPAKQRMQHVANRLVYGKRATPYETLSGFADRMSKAYGGEDVLAEMARLAGQATGAPGAAVWLRLDGDRVPSGVWPPDAEPPAPRDGEPATVPIREGGDVLGWIVIDRPEGVPIVPAEARLLEDLAAQAGLVLRNVRLIEELKGSRLRLVQAQDQERRRLERNIHDGAQQRLVALAVRFNLARQVLPADAEAERTAVGELAEQLQTALDDLRNLARGIYPPLLADKGLVAALESQAARSPLPVDVFAAGVARYPQATEAAVYFCCLEALQNVAKYARAAHALVRIDADDHELRFEVSDDGVGFDLASTPRGLGLTNMADRLAALDGALQVRSRPGEGTTIAGRIAVRALEPAAVVPAR